MWDNTHLWPDFALFSHSKYNTLDLFAFAQNCGAVFGSGSSDLPGVSFAYLLKGIASGIKGLISFT